MRKCTRFLFSVAIALAFAGNIAACNNNTQETSSPLSSESVESSSEFNSLEDSESSSEEIIEDECDCSSDPYVNISKTEFYANYTTACCNVDAKWRSYHGFMSGSLIVPDQAPIVSSYQPTKNGNLIRNSETLYSEDGQAYTVVDAYGNPAFKVFREGAYITLEEVAAFVYAFGTYPANHTPNKVNNVGTSVWGEYLRGNHSKFSGNVSKYPYEPKLPNISGCGGTLQYYEMDVGTTGTDCDPGYAVTIYNNGSKITRGAARIVYGKYDIDRDGTFELGEWHVFYTYNHYNDFQEYLNYEGGWGEMFGNITGGGTLSSKYDYNPTQYENVTFIELPEFSSTTTLSCDYYLQDSEKRRFFA
ncbi:MAG: hypothetical protein E7371_06370 [Clostridiales bacterium]|nr:hypothetical protein [Clostridiales bacterium]